MLERYFEFIDGALHLIRFALIALTLTSGAAFSQSATQCDLACREFLRQYGESQSAPSGLAAKDTFVPNAEFSSDEIFRKPIQKGLNTRSLEIKRDLRAIESLSTSRNIFK